MAGTKAPDKVRPVRRSSREDTATRVLARVAEILHSTCEQDGQGANLQEIARRKAYRAGINRALAAITAFQRDR